MAIQLSFFNRHIFSLNAYLVCDERGVCLGLVYSNAQVCESTIKLIIHVMYKEKNINHPTHIC